MSTHPIMPATSPRDLPTVDEQRIKKCAGCDEYLISQGPTFWLVQPSRGIFDPQGLKERVGLSMMMGGNAALGSLFAATPAAREFDRLDEVCVCESCACTRPIASLVLGE